MFAETLRGDMDGAMRTTTMIIRFKTANSQQARLPMRMAMHFKPKTSLGYDRYLAHRDWRRTGSGSW